MLTERQCQADLRPLIYVLNILSRLARDEATGRFPGLYVITAGGNQRLPFRCATTSITFTPMRTLLAKRAAKAVARYRSTGRT